MVTGLKNMFPVLEMCEIQASWQTVVDDVGLNAVRRWLITSMLIFYGKLWDRKWSRNSQSKQISLPYLQSKESGLGNLLGLCFIGWGFSSANNTKCYEKWKKHNMLCCLNQNKFLCHIYKAKKVVGESDRICFSGLGFSSANKKIVNS